MLSEKTIIAVLGYPANDNGAPGPILTSRLDKAIELYREGHAGKIIVTGAAVGNSFVEAEVMAVYCIKNGIPAQDILLESRARNTYDNARLVNKIMMEHGYEKAIVVTSSFHKMRAELFFKKYVRDMIIITAPFPASFSIVKKAIYSLKEYLILILFNLGLLNGRYAVHQT